MDSLLSGGDPESISSYALEARLGTGGMGVVYLARSSSGRRVAVKVVHQQFADDKEFRIRFRQEIVAARKVSGAFTAAVIDADPEAVRPWMATSYIPGPTLAQRLAASGPLGGAQLRQLAVGLVEALCDIHRVKVVHRDLKPANIVLSAEGPKVIDFGISRATDHQLLTTTGQVMGTPPFMSPEQVCTPKDVGPASDVFSLATVVIYAATGKGPFDTESPYMTAYKVVHEPPDLNTVPEPLKDIAERCLDKNPSRRPDLAELLRSFEKLPDSAPLLPVQADRCDDPTDPENAAYRPTGGVLAPGATHGSPSLDEYDITLERIDEDLDGNAHELAGLRGRLGDGGAVAKSEAPRVVRGEVADHGENAVTSGDGPARRTSQRGGFGRWRRALFVSGTRRTRRMVAAAVIVAIASGVSLPFLFHSPPKQPEPAEALIALLKKSTALADALQDERDLSAGPLTQGHKNDDFVRSTREDTDKARRAFLDSTDLPNESDLVGVRASVVEIIHQLNELYRIRRSAYTTPDYVSQTANSYNQLIEGLLDLSQDMVQATSNSDMIRRTQALNAFSSAKEDYSMQRAILSAALANPKGPQLSDSDRYVARTAFQSEKSDLTRFAQLYGRGANKLTKGIDGSVVEIQLAEKFRERAVTSEKGIQTGDRSYLDWTDMATVKLDAMDKVQTALLNQLEQQAGATPS